MASVEPCVMMVRLMVEVMALALEGLADAVENHHRFVHRIAQHRQHRGQHGEREFPLEEGKKAEDDDHIVQVGHNRGDRELPLEAKGQIHRDADDHEHERQQAVGGQLLAHLWPHKFGAAQLHRRVLRAQRLQHRLALLARAHAGQRRQAHQHIARGAKVLHRYFFIAKAGQGAAHLLQVGRLLVGHFDHRAAGELDRQV